MKQSSYNLTITKDNNTAIIFNGFSKKYVIVSLKYLNNYLRVIKKPDEYANNETYQDLINKLYIGGFIIDNNKDEYDTLKKLYQNKVSIPSYSLLIMTTYACNFKCWYCVQDHKNLVMNSETENRIKKHISRYLKENKIKHFELSWFGGEPLLNTKTIEDISDFSMKFCYNNNIEYNCGITTNGSLLSPLLIKRLKKIQCKDYQITIDGAKSFHNTTKKSSTISNSFELILRNIVLIAQIIPDARITLRINYTHKNLTEELPQQVDEILHDVKDRICLLFRQVWQERDSLQSNDCLKNMMAIFQKMGYTVEHDFFDFTSLSCYVENKHYLSIYPDGAIENCNNKPLEKARGFLDENGNVVWKKEPMERIKNIFESPSDCQDCKYLPICMGPCPAARESYTVDAIIKCNILDRDNFFKNQIMEYCVVSNPKGYKE